MSAGSERARDPILAEGKPGTLERAAGLTLLAIGGITLIDSLHVFENGVLNLDSLIHTEITGEPGPSGRTMVSNGGVGMVCDPSWAIDDFAVGWSRHLGKDASDGGRRDEPEGVGKELGDKVRTIAASITSQSHGGTLLVAGSTDPLQFYKRPIRYNANLAATRAGVVQAELAEAFRVAGVPRNIILANEVMTFADSRSGPPDPLISNGLARMLFGPNERSGRTVVVCLLEPRPHVVETSPGGSGGGGIASSYLQGVAVGMAAMAGTFGAAIVIGLLAWRAIRGYLQRLRKQQGDGGAGPAPVRGGGEGDGRS